ncbi:hypothetical protein COW36_10375 [bacterium (Candidatus Blackallbacteria) CG17_big_fil_post_rev_8_21_14_2_50_48_46]|uniref:Uncharacterized protein n=1 Tax=bacterium (Candidatus Blackallbacteria) CG17_big_fil_post_rev_8_21_14_2_50_48_46 TaxID=2014261 RepID=A0A2M7G571_9BACT|nr:MAG: hypothetical protein COW64_20145 [bacterium (Candidatus Blackallbacteria) CG18_big_fil_WC_8_21_14_2_50_49_26]PIW17038.1 MAG: hypothetical protein COW36_10375 [bacterium (Candidatus Blackallbacteria) CG17_big_fil_post_rev_8_21_14_2_50_48_46]PIW48153.1 MAG: hypothetical protein COW20_10300 [bacterium (Candidatus Blackallbacteria) CG13_big_fil_rev_8_21_14_2_50_49_14]
MSLRDLIQWLGQNPTWVGASLAILPLLTLFLPIFHRKGFGSLSPWKYIYSLLTYLVCIPGMFSAVLIGYSLFFVRENLLDANALVYFAPPVIMGITLALIGKQVSFNDLPGFDRLSGLMILIGGTFLILLFINKVFIGIFFGGSVVQLLAVGTAVFLLLKWATHAVFRGPGEPRKPRPSLFGN